MKLLLGKLNNDYMKIPSIYSQMIKAFILVWAYLAAKHKLNRNLLKSNNKIPTVFYMFCTIHVPTYILMWVKPICPEVKTFYFRKGEHTAIIDKSIDIELVRQSNKPFIV